MISRVFFNESPFGLAMACGYIVPYQSTDARMNSKKKKDKSRDACAKYMQIASAIAIQYIFRAVSVC